MYITYTYIYIYRERERDACIYIYIYIYIWAPRRAPRAQGRSTAGLPEAYIIFI